MHSPAIPCTSVSRTITAAGNLASLCAIHGGARAAPTSMQCSRRRGGPGCRDLQSLSRRARQSAGVLIGFVGRASLPPPACVEEQTTGGGQHDNANAHRLLGLAPPTIFAAGQNSAYPSLRSRERCTCEDGRRPRVEESLLNLAKSPKLPLRDPNNQTSQPRTRNPKFKILHPKS